MGNQRRVVTLLRWVMFLALACLTWASGSAAMVQFALLAIVAGSNIALSRLSPRLWEHPALLPIVAILDIGVLTGSMFWGQGFARDFFFAYFLLLAVVAMLPTLRLSIVGTTLVVAGYGAYLGFDVGTAFFQSPELIGRLGFLFSVGVAYGGLTEAGKVRMHDAAVLGQLVGWVGKMSAAFSDDFDAIDMIHSVLADMQAVMPGSPVRASLVQINDGTFQVIASGDDEDLREQPLDVHKYPELEKAIETLEPVIIEDIRKDPLTESVRDRVDKLPFRSLLLLPVNLKHSDIGHVVLRVAGKAGTCTPAAVSTAQHIADAIGVIFRQAKLRQAVERSERMEMVSQISNSVAHSFNSILSTVLLSSDSLRKEAEHHSDQSGCGVPPCGEEARARFESIELAVKEGLTIVERLNAWTKIGAERGDEDGKVTVIDPQALMEEAWRYAQPLWKRREATRDLKLRWQVEATPAIEGNAAELREVLLNLIINAIDAMPKGGTLTLRLAADEDQVSFSIEDTGIGIPEEYLTRVFESLFTTKGSAGTGLGLSIARSVTERHAGSLTFDSKEGVGTHFRLALPACDTQVENPRAEVGDVADASVAGRVLLVEANDLVADVMHRFLAAAELDVDVVASTDEAKVMLSTLRNYAGVLVDAGLALGDAGEFLESMHSERSDLDGRVIFYSNGALTEQLRSLQQLHQFTFIDRSAGLEALHGALADLADGRFATDSGEAAA